MLSVLVNCTKIGPLWLILTNIIIYCNCCHQLPDFKTKVHQIRFRLCGCAPDPAGELTALPSPHSWWVEGSLPLPKNPTPGLEPTVFTHFSFPTLACLLVPYLEQFHHDGKLCSHRTMLLDQSTLCLQLSHINDILYLVCHIDMFYLLNYSSRRESREYSNYPHLSVSDSVCLSAG